jgi:hypothetical protein
VNWAVRAMRFVDFNLIVLHCNAKSQHCSTILAEEFVTDPLSNPLCENVRWVKLMQIMVLHSWQ